MSLLNSVYIGNILITSAYLGDTPLTILIVGQQGGPVPDPGYTFINWFDNTSANWTDTTLIQTIL